MNDHINPNYEIDDELLSAYLDDELTASERVVVKQAIENSPPLRESLQELKVLSDEIQCFAVEFHPNEQQLLDTVITKIRDRNLSVHGQAPYSNVKTPVMGKNWKQRLQIPVVLALTASVLAVLTLQFMPNEQSMTLVQTERMDATPSVESFHRAENNAGKSKTFTNQDPPLDGNEDEFGAKMSVLSGGLSEFADERELEENKKSRDNASRQAADPSAAAGGPAESSPSHTPLHYASEEAESEDKQQFNIQAVDIKADIADVTYHIQVKQKDLPTLLALITTHQKLAQNMQRKESVGLSGENKSIAKNPPRRIAADEPVKNSVRKSAGNQIVMFRSNTNQLEALVGNLQKNSAFVLSMNNLQRATQEKQKKTPSTDSKDQSTIITLSDTIFSIQVIAAP